MQFGIARHLLQQCLVALDRAIDVTERHQDARVCHADSGIARLGCHQAFALFTRTLVLVKIDKGENQVVAR